MTILIVDDNEQNRYQLEILLGSCNYQVVSAANGIEALAKARQSPPDVIVSDILMPGMDGFSLCREWKKDERLRSIPFIFYTATYTDERDREFALGLGAERFLIKPSEADAFIQTIQEVIEKVHASPSPPAPMPAKAHKDEGVFLKQYNEVLIRKLEAKMQELEKANRILEDDIAERKRAEEVLRENESKYRTLIENIPQKIYFKNRDLVYVSCNRNYAKDLKITPDDIGGKTDFDLFPKELADKYRMDDKRIIESGQTEDTEELRTKDGIESWIWTFKTPVRDEKNAIIGLLVIFCDITERKRAEKERRILQDQMAQSQKIESIGRLAGGIAHDFNNILGVIVASAELMLLKMNPANKLYSYPKEIQAAAKRSTDIIRQLLAFARSQPINPKSLDLNVTVTGMLKILRRLIGEDIELIWKPETGLWLIKMDPSQLDQILANLCVNARDAIAGTGKVIIETNNVAFKAADNRYPEGLTPGEYVRLTMRDNGCGMSKETLSHLFEPFFTTKDLGKGTGLGLATVYGVVKQNDGFINVSSEPNQGTIFEIFFPRHTAPAEPERIHIPGMPAIGGKETVLLVEDDPGILRSTQTILETLGYKVLGASTPGKAVRLAKQHSGEIHLLLTDVIMPEMNGKDMSKQIQAHNPNIKSLFMSGYPANVIAPRGILEEGIYFLQKPFSVNELASKVREVLDRKQPKG